MKETLCEYVKRVMEDKNLGVRDIERNSDKKITASHVSKITAGAVTNLTADKIVGLALGLKVDPHEVFSVISGHPVREGNVPDILRVADVVQRLALNPSLLEAFHEFTRLDSKDQAKLLETLRFIKKRGKKPERKRKKR